MKTIFSVILASLWLSVSSQGNNALEIEIITSDIDNFWEAYDAAKPVFDPKVFQEMYLDRGSKGVRGFMKDRIQSAENLALLVRSYSDYYASTRASTLRIAGMKNEITSSLSKLKELYPAAKFPPVYFVIGGLNSGGTTSGAGLIIGAEMYGKTDDASMDQLDDWLKTVLKPVDELPHIVAHELIHFQQKYGTRDLLSACIKEGSTDFIAELISGKHINQHIHDFANPREEELWAEFKERMHGKDYKGWLYSSTEGRPNDLGYWIGYKIAKAYYDKQPDKKKALEDILHIRNFDKFLQESNYAAQVGK